jgi:hypothetical protein
VHAEEANDLADRIVGLWIVATERGVEPPLGGGIPPG